MQTLRVLEAIRERARAPTTVPVDKKSIQELTGDVVRFCRRVGRDASSTSKQKRMPFEDGARSLVGNVRAAAVELARRRHAACVDRESAMRRVFPRTPSSSLFPTTTENALVGSALAIERAAAVMAPSWRAATEDLVEEGMGPLMSGTEEQLLQRELLQGSASELYRTLAMQRFHFALTYRRHAQTKVLEEVWRTDVDAASHRLTTSWGSSRLSPLLSVPLEGHAALGALLVDAMALLQNAVGVRCWISAGTLLGAVRHRSFIPWDDDVDVCIGRRDEAALLKYFAAQKGTSLGDNDVAAALEGIVLHPVVDGSRHWVLEHCPLFGYKLYDLNTTLPLDSDALLKRGAMCFGAFVDIFVVDDSGGCGENDALMPLDRLEARRTWPTESFRPSSTFPLVTLPFAFPSSSGTDQAGASTLASTTTTAMLPAPRDPADYLNRLYGSDWPRRAVIPQQQHYGLTLPTPLIIDDAEFLTNDNR